jgi:acetyl esterase
MARRDVLAMGVACAAAVAATTSVKASAAEASPRGSAAPAESSNPENQCPTDAPWPGNRLATMGLPFKTDYAALRERRMAEVSEELRDMYQFWSSHFTIRKLGVQAIRNHLQSPATGVLDPRVEAHNIEIPGPAGPIPTRIFRPKGAKGPLGVYLSTHGGGWVFGNGLTHIDAEESRAVLDWGCAVVHPDYRIAPEYKFPAAIEDCYAAFRYVVDHGESMGFDTARIGIGGGCAGASMATVVSLMARDAGGVKPAIQFLWSPSFDMRNNNESNYELAQGYSLSLEDADFVTSQYLRTRDDAEDWRASPLLAETMKGMPPAIIWVGEWDLLRSEARRYRDRLRDAGTTVHYIEGAQQGHGFLYFRNMKGQPTEYQKQTLPKINALIRSYIGPESLPGKT